MRGSRKTHLDPSDPFSCLLVLLAFTTPPHRDFQHVRWHERIDAFPSGFGVVVRPVGIAVMVGEVGSQNKERRR